MNYFNIINPTLMSTFKLNIPSTLKHGKRFVCCFPDRVYITCIGNFANAKVDKELNINSMLRPKHYYRVMAHMI